MSEHRYERFGETLSRETVELVKSRLNLVPPFINPEQHHSECEIPDKMFRWCNCGSLPPIPPARSESGFKTWENHVPHQGFWKRFRGSSVFLPIRERKLVRDILVALRKNVRHRG